MNHFQQVCGSPDQLVDFLNGRMDSDEIRAWESHLETCESCRVRLEQAAAEPVSWREAAQFLGEDAWHTGSCDTTSESPGVSPQTKQVLEILAPTDNPEMMGRLGGYEVSGVVGSGGMGVVLKALDPSLDRVIAIKVLAPHLATSGASRQRFAREAKAAAAVLHPNVIAIHSVSNNGALPYLIMPYVRGTSLQKRIDEEGSLPITEVLRIGSQIAAGLAAAHAQGLVHRDIKPANILLEEGVERVAITDFGLARAVDDASITHSGVIAGTPQYMSPEQARGEPVDQRSDLFSLGSLLYAMCTGHPPFRAESTYGVIRRITEDEPTSIQETNPGIPEWLCVIICKLMSKQADDRYASTEEVAGLLEDCLAHVQQPATVLLPASLNATSLKSRSFLSSNGNAMLSILGTLVVAVLAFVLFQQPEGQEHRSNEIVPATEAKAQPPRDEPKMGVKTDAGLEPILIALDQTAAAIKNLSVTTDYVKRQSFLLPFDSTIEMRLTTKAVIDSQGNSRNDTTGQQLNIEPDGKSVRTYRGRWMGTFKDGVARQLKWYEDNRPTASLNGVLTWHGIDPREFTTHFQRKPVPEILRSRGANIAERTEWDGRPVTIVETTPRVNKSDQRRYRFWIDTERKIVVRRAITIRFAEGQPWQEYARIEGREHHEIAPGIWLPTKVNYESLEVTAEVAPEKLSWSYSGVNHDWKVNEDLPDETFELEFPQGVRVNDHRPPTEKTKPEATAVAQRSDSSGVAATAETGKNWPLFRGDQIATGVAKCTLPDKLDLLWTIKVEDGAFESTPAIVDGVAYLGDLDGEVYAIALKTGAKKWTYETESGFIASPAVKDGLLYIGDYDGRLHCLDIKTGKLKWAFETDAEIDACVNFYKENIVFGSQDATLYCLNAKSGKLVWKYAIDDQIRCSPTIVGNRTFVAGCDSLLHVIDLDKGEEVSSVPIEAPTMATPAVLGARVFFGTEGGVFFSVNWKGDAKIVWTFTDERNSQPFRSSAAVTKDRVVFGGRTKKVYALSPADGKEVWHFATRQRVDCSPVIVGNRVFVGTSDGRLYGLDLKNGDKLWEFEASGGFTGSPAVADGRMVIATDRGVIYCFGEKKK